jgi:hypothetical protein
MFTQLVACFFEHFLPNMLFFMQSGGFPPVTAWVNSGSEKPFQFVSMRDHVMTDINENGQIAAIADATNELNRLLQVGTFSERLMRLYALQEIVNRLAPDQLLKAAANLSASLPILSEQRAA